MKIVYDFPPNIEIIRKNFNLTGKENVVFTYGDTLYNPAGNAIDSALMEHEKTHSLQQRDNPNEWWDKYIADKEFRLTQEIEAYRNQAKVAKKLIKDRNHLFRYYNRLALDLSSDLYGNLLTYQQAMEKIYA